MEFQFRDQLFHPLAQQHFARVGRLDAGVDDVEFFRQFGFADDCLKLRASGQVARNPVGISVVPHLFGEGAAPQVQIHDDDLLARRGERHGQVGRNERLSGGGIRRGDHNDFYLALAQVHEVHVRADHAESFRHRIAAVFAYDEAAPLFFSRILRNIPQERNRKVVLDVLPPPDRGVEYLDQVDDQEGDAQSEQEGDSRNQHGIGRHGARGTVCTVDRARVAFRDDHGDGVLLAFVEQVEVKFLLDFLLTDDVQNLFFLRRYRGYSLIGQRLFLS